jgi:hypothetical protein
MAWNKRTMEWALVGLGLNMNSRLPDDGVTARRVPSPYGDVIVWVRGKTGDQFMRVMAICPYCCEVLSVSRLPQHVKAKTCNNNARTVEASRAKLSIDEEVQS